MNKFRVDVRLASPEHNQEELCFANLALRELDRIVKRSLDILCLALVPALIIFVVNAFIGDKNMSALFGPLWTATSKHYFEMTTVGLATIFMCLIRFQIGPLIRWKLSSSPLDLFQKADIERLSKSIPFVKTYVSAVQEMQGVLFQAEYEAMVEVLKTKPLEFQAELNSKLLNRKAHQVSPAAILPC